MDEMDEKNDEMTSKNLPNSSILEEEKKCHCLCSGDVIGCLKENAKTV